MTQAERLDRACVARTTREPYFAESWRAARKLLRSAIFGVDMSGADVIRWANGCACRGGRCGCQGHTRCLHEMAFDIYAGGTP